MTLGTTRRRRREAWKAAAVRLTSLGVAQG